MSKDNWNEIKKELMAAWELIPDDVNQSDYGYREEDFKSYIAANELLLAMEELDGIIEDNRSPGKQFWKHLINAAKLMKHKASIERYEYIKSNAT